MRLSAIGLAEREASASAFLYLFAFPCPLDPRVGAFHGLEVPFVFDCTDRSPMTGQGADARAVAAAMGDAWVRFAATGDPGWPAYTADERATMVFDVEPRVELDPGGTERRVLEDLGLSW
jgi:para-nitrobenzyl esterase